MGSNFIIGIVIVAVGLAVGALILSRRVMVVDETMPQVKMFGMYSPILTWFKYKRLPRFQWQLSPATDLWARVRSSVWVAAETGVVVLWAMWVGRAYLDLNPLVWPLGGDWGMNAQVYFPWARFQECGACVLWNGVVNGGAPTFVQLVGAVAHPLMVFFILGWGVINATKLAVVAGLAMAGLAQWWLAKVLRLGVVPRLWSAALVVVGGHLLGRMEAGLVEEVFSAAACALVIPPLLQFVLTGERRAAILAGVAMGLALLAGQAYMQLGLILGVLPAFAIFLVDDQGRLSPLWKGFVLFGLLAGLLAAVFWVPFLHFAANFIKPTDPTFAQAQVLEYLPLNLVIRDPNFFRSQVLKDYAYPAWYVNYIGWVPVLLAAIGLLRGGREWIKLRVFFAVSITLVYLASSAVVLKWLSVLWPDFMAGIRTPSVMTSLAVPLILGLAAWGLDLLLKLSWPKIVLVLASGAKSVALNTCWIVLAVPLLWAVKSAYDFEATWSLVGPGLVLNYDVLTAVRLDRTQWVQPPGGEVLFSLAAADMGFKVAQTTSPWVWKEHSFPPSYIDVTRDEVDTQASNYLGTLKGLNLVSHLENEYAFVTVDAQKIPCRAVGVGGNIDVDCESSASGVLTVYENQWSGWSVKRDGQPMRLMPGQWLTTTAPAGSHHYEFRYRPWDVPLGAGLSVIGLVWAGWLWRRDRS